MPGDGLFSRHGRSGYGYQETRQGPYPLNDDCGWATGMAPAWPCVRPCGSTGYVRNLGFRLLCPLPRVTRRGAVCRGFSLSLYCVGPGFHGFGALFYSFLATGDVRNRLPSSAGPRPSARGIIGRLPLRRQPGVAVTAKLPQSASQAMATAASVATWGNRMLIRSWKKKKSWHVGARMPSIRGRNHGTEKKKTRSRSSGSFVAGIRPPRWPCERPGRPSGPPPPWPRCPRCSW